MLRLSSPHAAVLAALALAASVSADVLVVAPNGAPYDQIQAAVAAAHDGDVVLVESGVFNGFEISDKRVSVVADVGATVWVMGGASVRSLGGSRAVLLHHLQLAGAATGSVGFRTSACTGSVRVQNCSIDSGPIKPGALIDNSSDVALTRCAVRGGNGISDIFHRDGSPAGFVSSSRVALYGCEWNGGNGAPTSCTGGNGGHGVSVRASFAFAGDSLLHGGNGSNGGVGPGTGYSDGGNAGDGAFIQSGPGFPARFESFGSVLTPGLPGGGSYAYDCHCGFTTHCSGETGSFGVPILANPGTSVELFLGLPPLLQADTNPAREQSNVSLTFYGQPGDHVALLINSEAAFEPAYPNKGVRLVSREGEALVFFVGTLNPNGTLSATWTVPELGPGVEAQILHMQAFHEDAAGRSVLSNPVHLVELDRAF